VPAKPKPVEGEKKVFMTGNEVVAWAAAAAGAECMYGYPITPQNEIMHYWTRLAPKFGLIFLQTEDELAAGFTMLGGVLAGRKSFTATAGPGNTLMQEPLSMAEMMRLPAVVVIQQRGGPSTGQVVYSQQEVTLTSLGGNGEGLRVVYSTSSHQDLYDYTIKAFNTAWRYRFPTFVLGDGYQGKMREPVVMYDPELRGVELVPAEPYVGRPGTPGVDRPPAHLRNAYSIEEELYEAVMELVREYEKVAPEIVEHEAFGVDGARVVAVAHGVVFRAVKGVVRELRQQGVPVGYFRPITLRPFPADALRRVAATGVRLLVVESAYGQLARLVKEALSGLPAEVHGLYKPGVLVGQGEIATRIKTLVQGG